MWLTRKPKKSAEELPVSTIAPPPPPKPFQIFYGAFSTFQLWERVVTSSKYHVGTNRNKLGITRNIIAAAVVWRLAASENLERKLRSARLRWAHGFRVAR